MFGTHSLRFLTPNTAVLVRIIQIDTNLGELKSLVTMVIHQKFLYLGFEIEVLHREVDGSFAEMKVCRVGLRNCFLHSFLSDMFLMAMS
jgi:hypothetical protein